MFVHGSVGHILVNMMMLWFAGKRVQDLYGPRHFVIYIFSGLAGAALDLVAGTMIAQMPDAPLVGASASVLGLVLAYAVAMPEEINLRLMLVLPVRFKLWGLAKFLLISNLALAALAVMKVLPEWLSGGGAPVAYLAHLGGAIAGWYYARILGYGGLPVDLMSFGSKVKPARRPSFAKARRAFAVELDEDLFAAKTRVVILWLISCVTRWIPF